MGRVAPTDYHFEALLGNVYLSQKLNRSSRYERPVKCATVGGASRMESAQCGFEENSLRPSESDSVVAEI
jgi:hypothetical protein